MANFYRKTSDIRFNAPQVIQQWVTGGEFTNAVPLDTALVFESGIWKYPQQATGGAVLVPKGTSTAPSSAVRLAAIQAAFGASTTWALHVAGNPDNVTNEPYPAGSAPLYREQDLLVDGGTAALTVNKTYGVRGGSTPLVAVFPGQTLYLTTSGATDPYVRFYFAPLTGMGSL